MADSVHRDVAEAMQTKIQAINGAGVYHYDFTGSDQVFIGIASHAVRPDKPTAFIALQATSSVTGEQLTRWTRTPTFVVEVIVPSDEDPGKQQLDAMDAMDDIMRALEADRTLGLTSSGVRDVLIGGTSFAGALIGFGRYGVASLEVRVTLNVQTGA